MAIFERGDVVKVPFPYTDRATRHSRPALVVSTEGLEDAHGLLWVLMITSAENRGWPGDIVIADPITAGLPAPSVIRTAKIATIAATHATRIGRIPAALRRRVLRQVAASLGTI